MNTDEWISALVDDLKTARKRTPSAWLAGALLAGGVASAATTYLLFGVRSELAPALRDPGLWLKFVFAAFVALGAFMALARLGTPGREPGRWLDCAWTPFALMAGLGTLTLSAMPQWLEDPWLTDLDWVSCSARVAIVSLPTMVALTLAMRQLAPTQLRLAGSMVGLLSGAVATFAYALYCPEVRIPFVALENGSAMVFSSALGAWLGPRLLRW
jgi:hypothetical protein